MQGPLGDTTVLIYSWKEPAQTVYTRHLLINNKLDLMENADASSKETHEAYFIFVGVFPTCLYLHSHNLFSL